MTDKIYLVDIEKFSKTDVLLLQSIQALLAKNCSTHLFFKDSNGLKNHELMLDDLYDLEKLYLNAIEEVVPLIRQYCKGYIRVGEHNVNNATSLAGIFDCILISDDTYGFEEKLIVEDDDPMWVINKYGSLFNQNIVFEQDTKGEKLYLLRDYIMMSRGFVFFESCMGDKRARILKAFEHSKFVIGWGNAGDLGSETPFIIQTSLMDKYYIPLDNILNLSFFSSNRLENKLEQNVLIEKNIENKHLVQFVISDGDNVQWFINRYNDEKWWGSKYRGMIPVTWSIPPTAIDLCPKILENLYATKKENESFILAPSGSGFCFPSLLSNEAKIASQKQITEVANALDIDTLKVLDLEGFNTSNYSYVSNTPIKHIYYYEWCGFKLDTSRGVIGDDILIIDSSSKIFEKDTHENLINQVNERTTNMTDNKAFTLVYVNNWSGENVVEDLVKISQKFSSNVKVVNAHTFNYYLYKK